MQINETTEIVEWLTIREFGTRAADAASQDFHDRQRHEIKSGLELEMIRSRWTDRSNRVGRFWHGACLGKLVPVNSQLDQGLRRWHRCHNHLA